MVLQDGESTSQFVLGDDDRLDDRDIDASVRALRPRSSRRGSWESEASGWSARIAGGGPGTPSLTRERSLWANNSTRGVNLNGDGAEETKGEEQEDSTSVDGKITSVAHTQPDELKPANPLSLSEGKDKVEPSGDAKAGDGESKLVKPGPQQQLRRPSIETIGTPETKNTGAESAPSVPCPPQA